MGSSANTDYCSFTKAVEHLGDRWSLLIVRELVMFGPQGFNALATGLPGHISRSVLAEKLRKLGDLGIVRRDPTNRGRHSPYALAPAGRELVPTLLSLKAWSDHWVPEDPTMAQRDPTVISVWLADRIDAGALPANQVVIDLTIRGANVVRSWLVLEREAEPSLCAEDPLLDESRYVYVEADGAALYPISRGLRGWTDAIGDGSVEVFGDPQLIRQLPGWFGEVGTKSAVA